MRPSWGTLPVVLLAYALTGTTTPSVGSSPPAGASSVTVVVFDVPGAKHTFAHGINRAGQIVGNFWDAGNKSHGFL